MNDNLKKLWRDYQTEAEKIRRKNSKFSAVIPGVFLLPPVPNEERIAKLSQDGSAEDILKKVKGIPIFLLPKKAAKNFSAEVLILQNEQSKNLLNRAIHIMQSTTSPTKKDADKLLKVLTQTGVFFQISKTCLGQIFAAFCVKEEMEYKGCFGFTAAELSNILLLDENYNLQEENGSIKTASVYKDKQELTAAPPLQTNEDVSSIQEDIKKFCNLLKKNYQIILTGAPGTGKTYLAKQIAYLLTGDTKDTPEEESHIGFVQFHPSFDYTDFVEGLRPVPPKDENGSIGFERQDGIFKVFCKRALKNYLDSQKTKPQIEAEDSAREKIDSFLNDAVEQQKILSTVNKNSFYIDSFDDDNIHIEVPGNEIKKDVVVPYGELLKIFADNLVLNKPGDVKTVFNRVHNRQHDSYLYVIYKEISLSKEKRAVAAAEKITLQNFVFIIDEINRGDISKIFGELFYAIDPGYRGSAGKVKTQYHNLIANTNDKYKDGFYIPPNVYIIGTMNDIDRSVESMDFAIRRRFTWQEIKAEDRISMWDGQIDQWRDKAIQKMKALNNEISQTDSLGDAFHIGPAYFLKLKEYEGNFDELWTLHIHPLLQEYLRGTANSEKELERFKNAYESNSTTETGEVSESDSTTSEE